MHLGFQLGFQLIFSAFGGGLLKEDKKNIKRSALLSAEQKSLYDKIVRDLFDCCSKVRIEHPISISGTAPIYAIIFRQSESWNSLEDLFNRIPNPDYEMSVWIEKWLQRISDLRGLQKRIHNSANHILQEKKQLCGDQKLEPHKTSRVSKAIETYKKVIVYAKKRIVDILEDAFKEYSKDLCDIKLTQNPCSALVLKFLQENWLHLTVFSEWAEVPMDERRLFVQVRQPKDPLLDEAQFVNLSTKAIFTIEEVDSKKQESQNNELNNAFIVTPKEIGLIRQCIGPKSPNPTRRSASSVVLTQEEFYNYEYVEDVTKTTNQPTQSSLADTLHLIVNLSLDKVNERLAKREGIVNLAPPSSASEGPRLDLSVFVTKLFGTGTNI